MNSPKVKSLFQLRNAVIRTNTIRYKSGKDQAAKEKNLKYGEPVKVWERVALMGGILFFVNWQLNFRHWEWIMDGGPGGILGHNIGKYFYRLPIADQIAEQKKKDYAAGIDWKIKIFQE